MLYVVRCPLCVVYCCSLRCVRCLLSLFELVGPFFGLLLFADVVCDGCCSLRIVCGLLLGVVVCFVFVVACCVVFVVVVVVLSCCWV